MRRFAQLMLGAALVLALGPTISFIVGPAPSSDEAWWAQMEICTASGATMTAPADLPDQDRTGMAHGACPLCYVQCHSPALPEPPILALPTPIGTHLLVLGNSGTVSFPAAYYRLRHSRAPPILT